MGNPNPRTILATSGNLTYFIVIEGRTEQYEGATIEQMYDLLSYLRVDNAINLDGGASSSLMWKFNNKVYSPLPTIARKTISSVISVV